MQTTYWAENRKCNVRLEDPDLGNIKMKYVKI
jgi:hypothetical protein